MLLALLCSGCKSPFDDFSLTFKEPVTDGKLLFTIRNFSGQIPDDVKLKVSGSDADLLVNSLNDTSYNLNEEGQLLLAVERSVVPTAADPVEFNIRISAPGYSTRTYNIRFTSRENQNYTVRLAELGKGAIQGYQLPAGGAGTQNFTASDGKATVSLTVPENQSWQTVTGEKAIGEVNLDLIYYSGNARSYIPGGGRVTHPKLPDGSAAAFPFDIPVVDAMLEVQAHDEEANLNTDFSRPLGTRLYLPTGKAGDKRVLLSYSPEKARWIREGELTLQSGPTGSVYADFEMTHFSFWIIGEVREICPQGPLFRISSEYSDLDIAYYFEVKKGAELLRNGYLNANKGASLSLSYLPVEAGEMNLKIMDFSDFQGGDRTKAIYESAVLPVCDTGEYRVDLRSKIKPVPVEVTFEAACPNGKVLDEAKLPAQMLTQISAPGQNAWRTLLTFTRTTRKIKTYRLVKGQTYDFRISTDGGNTWPFLQSNYTIDKNEWTIKVDTEGYCK